MFFRIRYVVVLAVVAALLGALLLVLIGSWHTIDAYLTLFQSGQVEAGGSVTQVAAVLLIESVDKFLLALALLYVAYSIYFLFVHDEEVYKKGGVEIRMPEWLQVESLGEMKRVLLEVILVLLAVYVVELVFVEQVDLAWSIMVIPATMLVIAITLKLVPFE
jgi:uncharacterized membrane protein YqhA